MEGKYYENGDATLLVLKVLEKENGEKIIISLKYSGNHKIYNIEILTDIQFNEWFLQNELIDFEFDDISYRGLM